MIGRRDLLKTVPALGFTLAFPELAIATSSCTAPLTGTVIDEGTTPTAWPSAMLTANTPLRTNATPELFGFNVCWASFEGSGAFSAAQRDQMAIKLGADFPGALYRYPGGTPSNYFNWRQALASSSRALQYYQFAPTSSHAVSAVNMGIDEFFSFVSAAGGKVVYTLNLMQPAYQNQAQTGWVVNQKWPGATQADQDAAAAADIMQLVDYLEAHYSNLISYYELGNELDLPTIPGTTTPLWTGAQYASCCDTVIKAIRAKYVGRKILIHGQTSYSTNPTWISSVAPNMTTVPDGIAIHVYYDYGFYIQDVATFATKNQYSAWGTLPVVVTEHARYDTCITQGGSCNAVDDSGGLAATSTADYTIMTMTSPMFAGSCYQAIEVAPWTVFHPDATNNTIYTSATYEALKALRKGLLADVTTTYASQNPKNNQNTASPYSYGGGYQMRHCSTTDGAGKTAIMGVNRDSIPVTFYFTWAAATSTLTFNETAHLDSCTDNSLANQTAYQMTTTSFPAASHRSGNVITFTVAPRSVFTYVTV